MGKLLLRAFPRTALPVVLAAACGTTGGVRDLEARLAAATSERERGRVLYEGSCQRCHALFMPRTYTADEWRYYVRKYGRRARLSPERRALVYDYLAGSARQ